MGETCKRRAQNWNRAREIPGARPLLSWPKAGRSPTIPDDGTRAAVRLTISEAAIAVSSSSCRTVIGCFAGKVAPCPFEGIESAVEHLAEHKAVLIGQ